jgi:hypothetical protein
MNKNLQHYTATPAAQAAVQHAVEIILADPAHPRLEPDVAARYAGYIEQWLADPAMPLFRRTGQKELKGTWFECEGRTIIYTDNAPAQWLYRYAYEHPDGTYEDLQAANASLQIPAAAVVTRAARQHPNFLGMPALSEKTGVNRLGYELAHIVEIKLGKLATPTLEAYKAHFKKFMSVTNMALVPKMFGLNGAVSWYYKQSGLKAHAATTNN